MFKNWGCQHEASLYYKQKTIIYYTDLCHTYNNPIYEYVIRIFGTWQNCQQKNTKILSVDLLTGLNSGLSYYGGHIDFTWAAVMYGCVGNISLHCMAYFVAGSDLVLWPCARPLSLISKFAAKPSDALRPRNTVKTLKSFCRAFTISASGFMI